MGFIADLSRFDPVEAVDQYDGVILNIEDPGFAAKRDRAIAKGKPWGTYSWVYPGDGRAAADRAHAVGTGPLGAWLDYEEEGVSPADLTAALERGDQLGMKLGIYTYFYILPTVEGLLGDHPLWLAYYPDKNDGTYEPWFSDGARTAGALLHQFTSSNGTRDLSVVLDDARWSAWIGEKPKPEPEPLRVEDDDMLFVFKPGSDEIWCVSGNTRRHVVPDEWTFRAGPYGGNPYSEGKPGGAYKAIKVTQAWFDSYPVAA